MGKLSLWLFFLPAIPAFSQASFEFVNSSASARLDALGGENVSLTDRDPSLMFFNPALVGDSLAGHVSANVRFYVADILASSITYMHEFSRLGTFTFGVAHMGYGEIQGYDPTGADLTPYHAGESMLVVGKSHQLGLFRLGVNIKAAFSSLAGYRSNALMADLGGVFIHPEEDWTIGLVFRNLGFVMDPYSGASRSQLPFVVEAGTTFKPEHMPVRFSITAHEFTRTTTLQTDPVTGEVRSGLDKLFGHLTFGAEVLLSRRLSFMSSYSFSRHRELSTGTGGAPGLSLGLSGNVNAFEFVISRSSYLAGEAGYSFSILMDWRALLR